jgi:ubiquinone/menaquinone biosynthesis C-methylase UbiE
MFDHFSFLAPFYDAFIRPVDPQELKTLAGLPVDGPLLDAAGGTGRISQFLYGQAKPLVVADFSFKMLQQAGGKDPLRPVCANTGCLPFKDGTFERVIMVDALHHVRDQQQTAGELWRVLQPGGRLVIEEPDIRTFGVKLVALAEKLALMRSRFLSPPHIATLFPFPDARQRIILKDSTAWVVVEKHDR